MLSAGWRSDFRFGVAMGSHHRFVNRDKYSNSAIGVNVNALVSPRP